MLSQLTLLIGLLIGINDKKYFFIIILSLNGGSIGGCRMSDVLLITEQM